MPNETYIDEYLDMLGEISLVNKYLRKYTAILTRAAQRADSKASAQAVLGYVEGHHVIPKSIAPKFADDEWNIVFLTAKEHFVCHHLLTKFAKPGNFRYKMNVAYTHMKKQSAYKPGNKNNEKARYLQVRHRVETAEEETPMLRLQRALIAKG